MKRHLILLFAFIFCICLSPIFSQEEKKETQNTNVGTEAIQKEKEVKEETPNEETKKEDRWLTDHDSALQSAKEKNKNIFIDFYAEWNAPCKMMEKIFADDKVITAMQDMILLRVDVDKNKEVSQKYNVSRIPTYIILDSNSLLIDRFSGYYEVEEFLDKLNEVKEGIGTFKSLKESVEKNPEDVDITFKLFVKYLDIGDIDNAKAMAGTVKKLDAENQKGYYAEALFYEGSFAIGEQDFDKAIGIYDEFIKKFPQDKKIENVMYFRALLYVMKGEIDTSIKLFEEFKEKFPDSHSKAKVEEILGQLEKMKEQEALQKEQQEQGKTQEQQIPQEPEKTPEETPEKEM